MMIFSEDTEIVRPSSTVFVSYSTSLLEAGKLKRMACFMTSPVGDLSYSPKPAPICREAPSIFRVHQSKLFGSISYLRIYAKKSANTCPFNSRRGLN